MTKGKVQIEIDRAHEGCRWMWDVWIDGEFCKNGVEDTVKDAMDAVLEWLRGEVREHGIDVDEGLIGFEEMEHE